MLDVGDSRWVEIWNNVFMGYTKTATGEIEALAHVNVDTGMGLERTLVALDGLRSVYEVDTIAPVLDELAGLARSANHDRELRVMTDHMRAACFLICDGIAPSNKDRGYIVRRLLRRCLMFAQQRASRASRAACAGSRPCWNRRDDSAVVRARRVSVGERDLGGVR